MRKVSLITRTIQTTRANVLCLDINQAEPFNKEVILPRTYKTDESVLKKARELIDTDSVKAVSVVSTSVEETLYGMPENVFIENATVLPPRSVKNENETEN